MVRLRPSDRPDRQDLELVYRGEPAPEAFGELVAQLQTLHGVNRLTSATAGVNGATRRSRGRRRGRAGLSVPLRVAFHRQLERVEADVLELGRLVERATRQAVGALALADGEAARHIVAADAELNRRRYAVEDR